jgi:hypothetical protein
MSKQINALSINDHLNSFSIGGGLKTQYQNFVRLRFILLLPLPFTSHKQLGVILAQ